MSAIKTQTFVSQSSADWKTVIAVILAIAATSMAWSIGYDEQKKEIKAQSVVMEQDRIELRQKQARLEELQAQLEVAEQKISVYEGKNKPVKVAVSTSIIPEEKIKEVVNTNVITPVKEAVTFVYNGLKGLF